MTLVRTAELMADVRQSGRAVFAFNVITLEHAEAVAAGAEAARRPAILQVSENAVRFHHDRLAPLAAAATAVARAARVPLALHLDHVTGLDLLYAAHPEGFSSVMFDGSSLPYDDNVKATAEAVRWGRRRGIWVESELGRVGGKDGGAPLAAHTPGARTEPDEAARFVEATAVDALAAAVGSTHAMRERTAVLDTGLIRRLHGAVPVPLVLHGSSGVPDDGIRAAVAAGISKVNIGTALNAACTAAVRAHLAEHPEAVDPRTYLAHGRQAMADTVEHFLRLTAGPR